MTRARGRRIRSGGRRERAAAVRVQEPDGGRDRCRERHRRAGRARAGETGDDARAARPRRGAAAGGRVRGAVPQPGRRRRDDHRRPRRRGGAGAGRGGCPRDASAGGPARQQRRRRSRGDVRADVTRGVRVGGRHQPPRADPAHPSPAPGPAGGANAHVVNVSSIFGIIAPPGQTAYSTSKFGLRGFSEALRSALRPHGIGVTTVYPGGSGRRSRATRGRPRRSRRPMSRPVATPSTGCCGSRPRERPRWSCEPSSAVRAGSSSARAPASRPRRSHRAGRSRAGLPPDPGADTGLFGPAKAPR